MDLISFLIRFSILFALFLLMVQTVPLLVWLERRGSAFIQNRFGPNRVGPLGLTQLLADAIKFIFKEEFVPSKTRKLLFYISPILALIPAALALACMPLSPVFSVPSISIFSYDFGPYEFRIQGFDSHIGIVFLLGVSSLAVYSMLLAGWSSANKYSLLGALRATAQVISYELVLSLSLVGILLIYASFDFVDMIQFQSTKALSYSFFGKTYVFNSLPAWGIFYQPLGFILLFVALFAETNRLPFDLPEAEAELVAGYHTEYSGLKMNLFFIGEYGHMMVASLLMTLMYFGGYHLPFLPYETVLSFFESFGAKASFLTALFFFFVFLFKSFIFLWIFIWVRWTLPRFRYDQLMQLGWKNLLPWSLFNVFLTAIGIYL